MTGALMRSRQAHSDHSAWTARTKMQGGGQRDQHAGIAELGRRQSEDEEQRRRVLTAVVHGGEDRAEAVPDYISIREDLVSKETLVKLAQTQTEGDRGQHRDRDQLQ